MVNYPNRKTKMQSTSYSGQRGMSFEKELDEVNKYYRSNNIALIYKKPTPLQIVKVDYPKRERAVVREAYFQAPSTTDYNGIYKGQYIDFEAKETHSKTAFPLSNVHVHQIQHIKKVLEMGGIAFLLIKFNVLDKVFLLDGSLLNELYEASTKGGRKSISLTFLLENASLIEDKIIHMVDYLKVVEKIYLHDV